MKRCYQLWVMVTVFVVGMASAAAAVEDISWSTQANTMRGQNGRQVAYYCPPSGASSSRLWGTGVYTDDSSICTAAVHAGLITNYNGGKVVIEIRPGQPQYRGSHKNGLSSKDYGSYGGSFVFVSGREEPARHHEEKYDRPPVSGGHDSMPTEREEHLHRNHQHQPAAVSEISWTTSADSLRGQIGRRVTYFCHAGGALSSRLWGSRIYTDDSSICTAAVHAGLITTYNGGEVNIEIQSGQQAYHGSRHNGVVSKNYGPFHGSFMFVR